jgi:predicted DNA-binding protein (UPF0251 family)
MGFYSKTGSFSILIFLLSQQRDNVLFEQNRNVLFCINQVSSFPYRKEYPEMRKDTITMSTKELKRLHLVEQANEKLITQKEAANMLDISERQVRRLISNLRSSGPQGLVHKSRGKTSNRKFTPEFCTQIAAIYKKEFIGYKPKFFTELLTKEHSIKISKEAARKILTNNNLWTPKKKKCKHRTKRERKHHPGELVQLDGSVHQWFPGKEGYCVLMLYIDDATSRVFARFYAYEGTMPAMDSFRRYISLYGIPICLYSDRHSTYKNNNKKLSIEEELAGFKANTQFSRAATELSVSIIYAYSPQAKGRVERAFETFQDRLCKELHRKEITSMNEANIFLEKFLKDHNKQFSVKPTNSTDLHRQALPAHSLKKTLCIKTTRSIANDFTIRHDCQILQLKKPTIAKEACVEEHVDGKIVIRVNNETIPFSNVTKKFAKNVKQFPRTIKIDPVSLKEIAC